jgi:hypothetical protein
MYLVVRLRMVPHGHENRRAYGRLLFKALYLYLTSDKRRQIPFQSVIQCGLILTRLTAESFKLGPYLGTLMATSAELDIRQCTVPRVTHTEKCHRNVVRP